MNAQEIIDYIATSEKKTPVKVYVNTSAPVDFGSAKVFGSAGSFTVFGDWKELGPILEANRDKYTRFLRACQKGFADMQADPEEALGLLLANQDEENFPLTESVERRSFDVLLPIMETADAPFLSQDVSVWEENIDWLQKVGMIDAAFDPAEVMVDLLAE